LKVDENRLFYSRKKSIDLVFGNTMDLTRTLNPSKLRPLVNYTELTEVKAMERRREVANLNI
jgi:hypothetical protein